MNIALFIILQTHQMHMDSQKVEIQQLQVTMDLLNKGQSSLATKVHANKIQNIYVHE